MNKKPLQNGQLRFTDNITSLFEIIPIDPSFEYQSPNYQSILNNFNTDNSDYIINKAIDGLVDIDYVIEKSRLCMQSVEKNSSNLSHNSSEGLLFEQCHVSLSNSMDLKDIHDHEKFENKCSVDNQPESIPIKMILSKSSQREIKSVDYPNNSKNIKIKTSAASHVITEMKSEKELEPNENITKHIVTDITKENTTTIVGKKELNSIHFDNILPVRKKLNLEEYKRRRQNFDNSAIFDISSNFEVDKSKNSHVYFDTMQCISENKGLKYSHKQQTNNVESMLDTIKTDLEYKCFDPNIKVTKKTLQLNKSELRDTNSYIYKNQLKPIFSMEEPVILTRKTSSEIISDDIVLPQDTNFEEIVNVSIGINTTISLSPDFNMTATSKILSSTSLLLNISDTINKTNSNYFRKIEKDTQSNTSNKHLLEKDYSSLVNLKNDQEHGEDKIIMHLRKDRIKPQQISKIVQTDTLTHFVPLSKLGRMYDDDVMYKHKNLDSKSDFSYSDSNYFKNNKNMTKMDRFKRSNSRCSESTSSSTSSVSKRTKKKKRYDSSSSSSSSTNSNSSYDKSRETSTKREVINQTKRQKSPGISVLVIT